jgi:hypothetical protein
MKHCPGCGNTLPHPSDEAVRFAPERANRPSFHLQLGDGLAPLEDVAPEPRRNGGQPLREAVNQFNRSLADAERAARDAEREETEENAAAEPYDVGDDDDVIEAQTTEPRRRRRRRKPTQPPLALGHTIRVAVIVLAALVLSTVLAIMVPILSKVLIAGGCILFLASIIWLRRVLAMEGLVSRLLCQLVPGYSLFHLLKNREPNTAPGVLQLGSLFFVISGGLVYAWLGGVGVAPALTPQTTVVVGNPHAIDSACTKLLYGSKKIEAAEWLQDPDRKHWLAHYRHDQAVTLVEGLHRRKAAHVYVAGIRTTAQEQTATKLVIELAPRWSHDRDYIFAWCNKYLVHEKENRIPDDDQTYILLSLDVTP